MEAAKHEPDPSRVVAPRDRIAEYRARKIERGVLPLASSVDGSRFEFQASLDDLALQAGGYVVLEADGIGRLGQVLTLRIAPLDVGDLDPEAPRASRDEARGEYLAEITGAERRHDHGDRAVRCG